MSALPVTSTSGFGIRSVSGRMRWPSPAASTMAVRGVASRPADCVILDPLKTRCTPSYCLERRYVPVVPGPHGGECRMRQCPLQIAPYAGHMTQILRLAVAPVEPGENAQDLGGALRRHHGIKAFERGGVEALIEGPPVGDVACKQGLL